MSVAVGLEELHERVMEYGPVGLVVSVGDDARPHVVSAEIELDASELVAEVGSTTAKNATARQAVSLVWAARPGDIYCLIVDGSASVDTSGSTARMAVAPVRAVLHRIAGAPEENPSCVTVLDRRK